MFNAAAALLRFGQVQGVWLATPSVWPSGCSSGPAGEGEVGLLRNLRVMVAVLGWPTPYERSIWVPRTRTSVLWRALALAGRRAAASGMRLQLFPPLAGTAASAYPEPLPFSIWGR